MKFLVDTEREGATAFYASSGRIEFRKPRVFDSEKHKISDFKYAQAKMDGNRVLVIGRLEERKMHVVTTTGTDLSDKVMQCHWANLLSKRMLDLEYFDGELYLPGHGREALSTALADRSPDIRFAVFGHSLCPKNASLREVERIILERKCDLDVPDWEELADPEGKLLKVTKEEATVESLLSGVKSLGVHYDGIVLKNGMYSEWLKFKHKKSIDVVILGLKPAKEGKFEGQCGSLVCGCYDGESDIVYEVAKCSGMNGQIRSGLCEADIGRVIEITYERVGTRGRLQSPQFSAWRDDKLGSDCKLDQDPELAAAYAEEDE